MEVKAHLNRLRISPRKVRLVAGLVRKMNIDEARKQLEFLNKKSTNPILKLINSAVANAKNNFSLNEDNLYISEIFINEGQTMKRWRPRAMGRAARINKRTSCVTVILGEVIRKTIEAEDVKAEKEKISEGRKKEVANIETVDGVKKNESKESLEKTEAEKDDKKVETKI